MPDLIIIRLHPVGPTTGLDFRNYLKDLTITAFDLSFAHPEGVQVGQAKFDNNLALTDIVQHTQPPGGVGLPLAAATAVIQLNPPAGHPEYQYTDLHLTIERGTPTPHAIADRTIDYNTDTLIGVPLPPQGAYQTFTTITSTYVALPASGNDLDPNLAHLDLPTDGTPPSFDQLSAAMNIVLSKDPGGGQGLGGLTPPQARHVAHEIVWNRALYPLPVPPNQLALEDLYTLPGAPGHKDDREQFESGLVAYYATHDGEADHLSQFVYALSAAVTCEATSTAAANAGLHFPIRPAIASNPALITDAEVILDGLGAPNPAFTVPAQYFYALGVGLPLQITADQRYQTASQQNETHTLSALTIAIDAGVITEQAVNRKQAARRLRALGEAASSAPHVPVVANLVGLVNAWLAYNGDSSGLEAWWTGIVATPAMATAHLELVLYGVTEGYQPLVTAILNIPVNSVEALVGITAQQWHDLFIPPPPAPVNYGLLPPFTLPGTPEERVAAFIHHLQQFLNVTLNPGNAPVPKPGALPLLDRSSSDPLIAFLNEYQLITGATFTFGAPLNDAQIQAACAAVFPGDPAAQAWLDELLHTIEDLYELTQIGLPALQFSLMEALFARGFTSKASVQALTLAEFQEALTGTIAYDHATAIRAKVGPAPAPGTTGGGFQPINPDGCLVNCIPPTFRSPFGPVEYLHELLRVSLASTCANPFPGANLGTLETAIAARRGPIGSLHATRANLETPLPLIDLVNECLEHIAAHVPASVPGAVYDTAWDALADHKLQSNGGPAGIGPDGLFHHDPAMLFEALPQYSSPATPVAQPGAYDKLKGDFSSPALPYSQPLDISRSYLRQLGTTRFAAMRRFRQDITEFVLTPDAEPTQFQRNLWRYPVRIEIAREYLGISPEEYDLLFTKDIAFVSTPGQLVLHEVYGFHDNTVGSIPWTQIVVRVPEFLKRTGLTYCEFLELWQAQFVAFQALGNTTTFPECEPCCLDDYVIDFPNAPDPNQPLKELAVFIRLWRKLQAVYGARYTFAQLRDICDVLQLFQSGAINPDFVRQLAAFQMLRDDFGLQLTDGSQDPPNAIDDLRTHILALWVGTGAPKWGWAVGHLLDRVQHYAQEKHRHSRRSPHFLKLLASNLGPLSRLVGFDPTKDAITWHTVPTHTLRFAEILAKICASDFTVGEILFLFTANDHLDGDDPFPLGDEDEALDSPLDLPDDDDEHSLWVLRRKLLNVHVPDEEAEEWTWRRIEFSLRKEFGFVPPITGTDPLLSLGQHFFPGILAAAGHGGGASGRQYRANLTGTSPQMWNTPTDSPFRYDTAHQQLYTQLPLKDEDVIETLRRLRDLNGAEAAAVQELYFRPRADLAPFAFIFSNFTRAEQRLIEEEDEKERWTYFRREFARCHARCSILVEHLTHHVAAVTGETWEESCRPGWLVLQHLYADENLATTSWETDTGIVPNVTWTPPPNGGAFAALLGLIGTGLVGELTADGSNAPTWREVRGPLTAFGRERNYWNAPVPTILPSIGLTLTTAQKQFADLSNGFAFKVTHDDPLGGAQGFSVRWQGVLLVDHHGRYEFSAGAPTSDGERPDFEAAERRRWRVTLARGQKSWVVLSHHWPHEHAPGGHSEPLALKRGAYQITVEFVQPPPGFSGPEDVLRQHTGFQLKYAGPDSEDRPIAVPFDRLFVDHKDNTLANGIDLTGAPANFLNLRYTSTLRDIRRTYQRAFKALLFAHRFRLSAKPIVDYGQSELGYMLAHPDLFAGESYYRLGANYVSHLAFFDFNLLPLEDPYQPPAAAQDLRVAPFVRRQQALFDWWERMFDYAVMRREAQPARERPVWLLFDEAAEKQPDNPTQLLRHIGVDLLHAQLVLKYDPGLTLTSDNLEDDRWPVRIWHAEKWIRGVLLRFAARDITFAQPALWVADDPSLPAATSGNQNLTQFVRDGCIENGEPRRYAEIKRLNDGLRERARHALLAYLCGMNRVLLPWAGYAQAPKDLSDFLLLDVEAGICEKASRIEDAITAVQIYVQRCRLGLELNVIVTPAFILLWERQFATFHIWEVCKRRQVYRENWIDWDEIEKVCRTEAFQFLESQLRRATLTVPVAGGLEYWPDQRPPAHPALELLQVRDSSHLRILKPPPEGLGLLGTPERHARPSWLSEVQGQTPPTNGNGQPGNGNGQPAPSDVHIEDIVVVGPGTQPGNGQKVPLWMQAAIRLGVRFLRIAAAAEPPASTKFGPRDPESDTGCCCHCGKRHPALVDEYYFWLLDSRYYSTPETEPEQNADWGVDPTIEGSPSGWHQPDQLPTLLNWDSQPMVHLAWCRIHNGEFQPPRRSFEGLRIDPNAMLPGGPALTFLGREADSLPFSVSGGVAPTGYKDPEQPGFRYDLATDTAVVLPLVAAPLPLPPDAGYSNLPGYPYFAYHAPGEHLFPPSMFGPALAVARTLRAHCRFEAALKWYGLVYDPLHEDDAWAECAGDRGNGPNNPSLPVPVNTGSLNQPPPGPANPNGEGDQPPVEVLEVTVEGPSAAPPTGSSIIVTRPCCDSTVTSDEDARNRSITMHYLETLQQWADALMCRNSPEAFQQARLIIDTEARILGKHPLSILVEANPDSPTPTVDEFVPDCPPLNPRLLALYDLVDDRLALIHACINGNRLRNGRPNKDMPYWGDSPLRNGWQTTMDVCRDEDDWCCCCHEPYRYTFLIQKALEIANDVRSLGAALLNAYEKNDAEYLASLRALHERQLLNLALEVRENQWRAADWQVQAMEKTKEGAQQRRRYYKGLVQGGLISGEQQYESLTDSALGFQETGRVLEAISMILGLIPDFFLGSVDFTQIPVGTKLATTFSTSARISDSEAGSSTTTGSQRLTEAGWDRRLADWLEQIAVIDIEIQQIERQILAAQRQRDVSLRELNNHRRQMEQSAEVHDFLRDKFTNSELYLFLQQETAALHYQMYELALHTARQAERAFNFERGHTTRRFLPGEAWDDLHEGLLAGERLHLSLRQMETTYLCENVREYELTRHISLRLHFPIEFLRLRATGCCEIEIPEWMFDLDYPGQYMRRIKNVTLTLPCVVGPYTGVHCRLTLLSCTTRVAPYLIDPPSTCCDEDPLNGYEPIRDDPRIVKHYAATEAIATSSGQNDSGLFELSFRDDRYLPFEFQGAVSRWRIELPQENNQWDLDTLTDLVMHLNYTAREGGDILRRVANELAQHHLPGAGVRFFDMRHEFPDTWHRFHSIPADERSPRHLGLRLGREMFPFIPGHRELWINRLEILFEAPEAEPSTHHLVEFLVGPRNEHMKDDRDDCERYAINCIASSEWPGYYHGVLDVRLGPLSQRDYNLGTFRFSRHTGTVSQAFLFCGYNVAHWRSDGRLLRPGPQ